MVRKGPISEARILMYHNISDFPSERNIPYDNVSPWLFEKQMSMLIKERFNIISLSELINYIKNDILIPPKTIVITFDDGFKNNFTNAFPLLKKKGIKASFFLIVSAIGDKKPFKHLLWDENAIEYFKKNPESRMPIDWDEVNILKDWGMEIGSHGLTHKSIGSLSTEKAKIEISISKNILEKKLSKKVKVFSYPFGSGVYNDYNSHTSELLKEAGYEAACTTEIGSVNSGTNLYELPRIPVRETDNEFTLKQKIVGAYDWVNFFKIIFQKNVARIDKTD